VEDRHRELIGQLRNDSTDPYQASWEASRTALMSSRFSGLACLVIILLRKLKPSWIFDLGEFLRESKKYIGSITTY
jgi:hypothetical protein